MARTRKERDLIIAERRRLVASLRVRKLSLREIQRFLGSPDPKTGVPPNINEDTGEPWGLRTIAKDVRHLVETARANAIRDIGEHRAEILEDYEELLRVNWRERNYELVRKVLGDKRALLGTDRPQAVVHELLLDRLDVLLSVLERELDRETYERVIAALAAAEPDADLTPRVDGSAGAPAEARTVN